VRHFRTEVDRAITWLAREYGDKNQQGRHIGFQFRKLRKDREIAKATVIALRNLRAVESRSRTLTLFIVVGIHGSDAPQLFVSAVKRPDSLLKHVRSLTDFRGKNHGVARCRLRKGGYPLDSCTPNQVCSIDRSSAGLENN
jgi:hypothetical protein